MAFKENFTRKKKKTTLHPFLLDKPVFFFFFGRGEVKSLCFSTILFPFPPKNICNQTIKESKEVSFMEKYIQLNKLCPFQLNRQAYLTVFLSRMHQSSSKVSQIEKHVVRLGQLYQYLPMI